MIAINIVIASSKLCFCKVYFFLATVDHDDAEHEAKELRRHLWRAPELLRMQYPPSRGTQKGDIYSFAIVLYEILGRVGPWGRTGLTDEGTFIKYFYILS